MKVLVTGGKGFIGAWIIQRLSQRGHSVRVFDIDDDRRLVSEIAGADAAAACDWIVGDIVSVSAVRAAATGCDAIVHLAGVLTPACAADPVRGAEINLIGTLNVFEAARGAGIRRIAYTSSAGVFGPDDGVTPRPTTHYGAFKLATEGSARAYLADHGIASVGFRPFVVYGPGREVGLTAGPSLACRAAARGKRYVIPYTGSAGLVYVEDVADAYIEALERTPDGAHVVNLVGTVASNGDVVSAIRRVIPDADISVSGPPLPVVADIAEGDVRAILPGLRTTSLDDGVARTIAFYRSAR